MTHGLARCILGDHLRSVGRALARTFESNFTRARPTDHVACQIGDGDDRVVNSCVNMRDTAVNILGAFGFDDFRRFHRISV